MSEEYIGKNSKTEYAMVKIKQEATILVYLLLTTIILILILIPSINQIILDNKYKIIFYVISFTVGYIILNLIGFIIAYIFRITKNIKVIKYYKNNPLKDVQEVMIDYDYKLWQTAAIKSVHPMSFKSPINHETLKTAIIFTNHESFGLFPKFRMPEVLRAKNYINFNALMGFDEKNNEWIVINYIKK